MTPMENAITAAPEFYAEIESDLAHRLHQQADRIRARAKKTAVAIIEIGKDLLAVKEIIPHGMFGPWLRAEFTWDERTAQRYMQLAEAFGDKPDIVSDLPQRTLFKLARPSLANLRTDVLGKVEHGRLDLQELDAQINEHINLAKQDSILAKRKRQGAKRRSKRTERRHEQERLAQEERGRRQRETDEVIAAELIAEVGAEAIFSVLKALDRSWRLRAVLLEMLGPQLSTAPKSISPTTT